MRFLPIIALLMVTMDRSGSPVAYSSGLVPGSMGGNISTDTSIITMITARDTMAGSRHVANDPQNTAESFMVMRHTILMATRALMNISR
jgi:hypothetical protein